MKKILMTLTLALAAAIAIPASAKSTTTTEKTAQCCKEKKECSKEGEKTCAKEGKACCKEGKKECSKDGKASCKHGKKGFHKAKQGKMMKADRRNGGLKNKAMMRRGGGENPMFKGITLSEEQKLKVRDLREKSAAAERKYRAEAKAKSKDEMKKLRADFDKDQLKQFQANKAEMEAKRGASQDKLPKLEKKDK